MGNLTHEQGHLFLILNQQVKAQNQEFHGPEILRKIIDLMNVLFKALIEVLSSSANKSS